MAPNLDRYLRHSEICGKERAIVRVPVNVIHAEIVTGLHFDHAAVGLQQAALIGAHQVYAQKIPVRSMPAALAEPGHRHDIAIAYLDSVLPMVPRAQSVFILSATHLPNEGLRIRWLTFCARAG